MSAVFKPGDTVLRVAALYKWPVAERSIMVEGEHDQRYFALADRLYHDATGLRLLGHRLSVFPPGIGDEGGTYGIQRHFPTLRSVMDRDVTPQGRKVFHAIALFDHDSAGVHGFNMLTGQHLSYKKWRDVFLLRRIIPHESRDPTELLKAIDSANEPWRGMDCEIEDLIAVDLVETFVKDTPGAVTRSTERRAGGIHCFLKSHMKSQFARFVEANAILRDVEALVAVLKSFRYQLGLPADGE